MANKPDYFVGALNKIRDVRQPRVGAAWVNPDGTITIRLDPFVRLQGGPGLLVTLFPNRDKPTALRPKQSSHDEEEIPF